MSTVAGFIHPTECHTPAFITAELFSETPASQLADAFMKLYSAERLVLSLSYFHELTMMDIASVMKLSVQDVLMLHASAVRRLAYLLHTPGERQLDKSADQRFSEVRHYLWKEVGTVVSAREIAVPNRCRPKS